MKKKILSMLLIATMIVTMCMQTSVAFASQGETEEPFNSTITAISSDKDSFIIETGAGCLNGNVRGGSSISTANMNVNGSVTENANIKTPILLMQLMKSISLTLRVLVRLRNLKNWQQC